MQVLYLGRALRTKETLPDFLMWRRVTRPPLVFHGLMGSQRTPGFGSSQFVTQQGAIVLQGCIVHWLWNCIARESLQLYCALYVIVTVLRYSCPATLFIVS